MKKLSKLSLNTLKTNAESVLNKEELRSIKGGYGTCNYYSGGRLITGYTVACYNGSTYLGQACTGGPCIGEEPAFCSSQGYPNTTNAHCV